MVVKVVDLEQLVSANKWRVEMFIDNHHDDRSHQWPLLPLHQLAIESTRAISPNDFPEDLLLYVGLENVEAVTGEPVGLSKRPKAEIRSRSKVFEEGQILYGRLRPYLRKAFLTTSPFDSGICSTEFIVLTPNLEYILPQMLRALLVSQFATDQFSKFQVGASLPRVSSADFFSVRLPVPPLEIQKTWIESITPLEDAYRKAKSLIGVYPNRFDSSLEKLLTASDLATT